MYLKIAIELASMVKFSNDLDLMLCGYKSPLKVFAETLTSEYIKKRFIYYN